VSADCSRVPVGLWELFCAVCGIVWCGYGGVIF